MCGLFAAIFRGQSNNNHTVHQVYVYIIKVCMPSRSVLSVFLPSLACCQTTRVTWTDYTTNLCGSGYTCQSAALCLLQVLVCIFLWLIVDVIKTMAAKLMAGHFHQETYFQRMQEALQKVLLLLNSGCVHCNTGQPALCSDAELAAIAVSLAVNA